MKYILQHSNVEAGESAVLHCLTGKWLAETRSDRYINFARVSNIVRSSLRRLRLFPICTWLHALFVKYSFRVILDLYLGKSVELVEGAVKGVDRSAAIYVKWAQRLCRTHYRLAQYTDNLFKSYEDRLISSEWQAALRLRQHKVDCRCPKIYFECERTYLYNIFKLQKDSLLQLWDVNLLVPHLDISAICSLRSLMPWRNVFTVRRWVVRRCVLIVGLWDRPMHMNQYFREYTIVWSEVGSCVQFKHLNQRKVLILFKRFDSFNLLL